MPTTTNTNTNVRQQLKVLKAFVENGSLPKPINKDRKLNTVIDELLGMYKRNYNITLDVSGIERYFITLYTKERPKEGHLRVMGRLMVLMALYNRAKQFLSKKVRNGRVSAKSVPELNELVTSVEKMKSWTVWTPRGATATK